MKKVIGNMNYIKEDKYFNIQGCGTNPPTECCTENGPTDGFGFTPCEAHGCPPDCVSEVYETGSVRSGGGRNADIKITRGVPSKGSTTAGPRGQRMDQFTEFSNMSGCGLWMCGD